MIDQRLPPLTTRVRNRGYSRIWAICAYFNPCGYQTRRRNYRCFRQNLQVPLVTAELSFSGKFELASGDADRLVQVQGRDVMWQKERLLNLALEELPPECEAVAWLDADVLFQDPAWPEATLRALEDYPLVQPFSASRDYIDAAGEQLSEPSISYAAALQRGNVPRLSLEYDGNLVPVRRLCSPGFAWAARREILAKHGFYDTCVLGAGDRAMSQAALGNFKAEAERQMPTGGHKAHYLDWAGPFHSEISGRIGAVPGELRHLWHGSLSDRQYRVRFREFPRFEFDPSSDIALQESGSWKWSSDKPSLHRFARELFERRNEDGFPRAVASKRNSNASPDTFLSA